MSTTSSPAGSAADRPVLLIHGAAANTEAEWRAHGWVDSLEASGRTVIGIDLPGHGASADLVDRDPADLLLDAAAQHGSVDAIGFSAGAWALLVAASEQPDRFGRIAVLGVADRVLTDGLHTEAMQRPMADAVRSDAEPTDNPMAMMFRGMIANAGNDRKSVADYLTAKKRFPTLEDLARITATTLVVEGGNDMAGGSTLVAQTIPKSDRLVIDGVDHFEIPANAACKSAAGSFVNGVGG